MNGMGQTITPMIYVDAHNVHVITRRVMYKCADRAPMTSMFGRRLRRVWRAKYVCISVTWDNPNVAQVLRVCATALTGSVFSNVMLVLSLHCASVLHFQTAKFTVPSTRRHYLTAFTPPRLQAQISSRRHLHAWRRSNKPEPRTFPQDQAIGHSSAAPADQPIPSPAGPIPLLRCDGA